MSSARRPKWHPPPPPSPRILHLPRRTRRKAPKQLVSGKPVAVKETDQSCRNHRGKLETLLDQERSFSRTVPIVLLNTGECERRERVADFDNECGEKGRDFEDYKWRFQAEILRAECHFLRMEREIALKKLERNRAQMEMTLSSAVETLISGRRKISEGKNVGVELEEEIEDLEEKLEQLKKSSGVRDFDVRKCSNFDKQAVVLQKRIETLGGISEEERVEEIRELAEASLEISTNCRSNDSFVSDRKTRFTEVENLRRKMEGLSKGMLERMEEEYRSILSTATTSTSSSASTSRRIEFHDSFSSSFSSSSSTSTVIRQQPLQGTRNRACSGLCKSIIRNIVEQVRAESEQWSQMQEMLGQVREEMEELQASKEFWEDRAFHCEDRIRSLHSTAHEWKQKALSTENVVTELQKQISELRVEVESLRTEQKHKDQARTSGLPPLPRDSQKEEKEKRVLICRLKENHHIGSCNVGKQNEGLDDGKRRARRCSGGLVAAAAKRSPLRDVGNSSSPLNKQSSRAVFPLYLREPSSHSQDSP
ncbi:intracellular protein transport protein USO1-like isoform X2 [Macadamia integrifolia]|uniref:intracellular protein transport protein USO1-like isoform X2 n=1 Tax=Macadamia integrifolia TaxID=60698 RepID=UPI001C4ED972|nr:intracellular protein transport protein USO1-like isoform X2 [Macadamia integrifolia]